MTKQSKKDLELEKAERYKENRRKAQAAYRLRKKVVEGLIDRTILLTDAEYQAVLDLIKSMRS